jgi:hypothetical protein
MEKKKEVFTGWNWFILIACGLFGLFFLGGAIIFWHYNYLIIAILFWVGVYVMFQKLQNSKK